MSEPGGGREHAQLLPLLQAALASRRSEHRDDPLDLVGYGADFAQNRSDCLTFFRDDDAFVPIVGAERRFRQKRNVLRHHARLEADIRIGVALGGITELEARRRRVGAGEQG